MSFPDRSPPSPAVAAGSGGSYLPVMPDNIGGTSAAEQVVADDLNAIRLRP